LEEKRVVLSQVSKVDFELDQISHLLRSKALEARSFDCAMVFASLYGQLHWDNISGFFADEGLEQALFERWKDEFTAAEDPREDGTWCHILTRDEQGGHIRLLMQLANGLDYCGIRQTLLVSQKLTTQMRPEFSGPLRNTQVLEGSLAQRAHNCFAAGLHSNVVLMHIHPNDIVAALAARALQQAGKTVLFVNHADHVFSFGPGAADAVLEICAIGWKTSKERRHVRAQYFLGIPITSEREQLLPEIVNREAPILTIGSPVKYRPANELNFARFLEGLLSKVTNDIVLIGPNGSEAWWADLRNKFPDRVRFKGILPHDEVKQEYLQASCYVDSFPMDGGTTFSEAMMQGLASFGLNRQSSLGISPADEVRCNGEEDLINQVSGFLGGGEFPDRVRRARRKIAVELSSEATVRRLKEAARGQGVGIPDSFSSLGNRSIDYNAENWRAVGQLHIPRSLWRKLPILTRLQLFQQVGQKNFSKKTLKTLRKRILRG
jgi:hypothetical protein